MGGTKTLNRIRRTIAALHGEGPVAETIEEPLVTVEQMITELTDRDGVAPVYR